MSAVSTSDVAKTGNAELSLAKLEKSVALVERLLGQSTANDPQSLAAVHGALEGVRQALSGEASAPTELSDRAHDTMRLVEQLILQETTDVDAAMRRIATEIEQMRLMVSGALRQPIAPPVTPPTTEATAVPAPANTQPALLPDDIPLVSEFITEANAHVESAEAFVEARRRPAAPARRFNGAAFG